MQSDSFVSRLLSALAEEPPCIQGGATTYVSESPSSLADRYPATARPFIGLGHRLIAALAEEATGLGARSPQKYAQPQLANPGQDIVDFGLTATRSPQEFRPDKQRGGARPVFVILACMLVAALFIDIHWTQFFHDSGMRTSSKIPAAAAPFAFTGYGFESCDTPSLAAMRAWKSSRYRAIFVSVGGVNIGCSLGNLSASWVRSVRTLGWTVFPVYVGRQAPRTLSSGTITIDPRHASSEGNAAAADALHEVRQLEIPLNIPIFYDMEGYKHSTRSTDSVLKFLSAWDAKLNEAHTYSGVYGSRDSGVADIIKASLAQFPHFTRPNILLQAHWDGIASFSDPSFPAFWQNAQGKEYEGIVNKTIGGYALGGINLYTVKINLRSLKPAP